MIGLKCLKNELGEVLADAKDGKNAWRSFYIRKIRGMAFFNLI